MECYCGNILMVRMIIWGGSVCVVLLCCAAGARVEAGGQHQRVLSGGDVAAEGVHGGDEDLGHHTQELSDVDTSGAQDQLTTLDDQLTTINTHLKEDHTHLGGTLATLRAHLAAVRDVRRREETRSSIVAGDLLNQALLVSAANLRLLGQPATQQDLLGLAKMETYEDDGANATRRTLGDYCGGTSALGLFNFLTFMVYAFSLLLTLLTLATGSMANTLSGTYLPGLLHLLGHRGRGRRSARRGMWENLLAHVRARVHLAASRDTFSSSTRPSWVFMKPLYHLQSKAILSSRPSTFIESAGLPREFVLSLEQSLGGGVLSVLLQASGGSPQALLCGSPLTSATHHYLLTQAATRFNMSL
ncbi:uncharacterized protein LOC121865560 [Homarus americanus]|uniref:uncharacterized protein LOC121865560 n=1 Tax=Homarus americanus TaxID=6706 RepID=UPI001C4499CE|nr:uncharacterized protein LOC121865560 [Homarus americanus]